ncbi:saccharopine dehydrogenase [Trametes versicolor FP-101664 SS1]|uniref:saccharopine dehydrogenase n=1 Tax=Trametes versicolor (strain FP-101664) TaxID=717944 RepID=UPI0004622C5A|nr:saccharopine dehydrogenase [Trametes versicolor FP-101664 SS1]EIW52198.1 saccharopine dehydrogenase [Trametes versicolor FP-101664 SS1]
MAPLTHRSIKDGWFREISSQWPGQAMTLKVNRILHVEKSLYQDVLVFESATYGNVLVLDGVIQCTERDEFSYQEMIAHLPLASHPNPKKVLVIGGGDGGVVREVLKHDTVEQVVLCDIDEAVIRVSKQFLPHMSSLLNDPRVTVFVGDGFKFLADNTSTYDVIITDSSDPVGPAASLFQKPYFELLRDALTPGGHISTQGECLWIHLALIEDLLKTTRSLFPVSEYAFTTIPTYPSGQIGFMVCSKEAGRDLSKPLRTVPNTRYYNSEVHKAAFVLPEFGRSLLKDGKDLRPVFGANAASKAPSKKVLLLGSGAVARPCAEYVVRNPENSLTIACRTLASAQALAGELPNTTAASLDAGSEDPAKQAALEKAIGEHDLVISLVPYTFHVNVIKAAIRTKTNVVTTSYISPGIRELEDEIKKAGIVVMNEIGLDPGVDHLYAIKTIDEVHAKGGKVKEFHSFCGGLPAPECSDNPLGYKFSWSPRGGLLALLNDAAYLADGKTVEVPGKNLMSVAKSYFITPAFGFVSYPNRNSVPFREYYNIPEAENVIRGTLRYQGFPEFVKALVALGWLNIEKKAWLKEGLTWAQVMQQAIGASDASESTLVARVKELCQFPNEAESRRIISGLKWIGLFTSEPATVRDGTLLDTLCARLEVLMKYEDGERDLVMLQHKFIVEWADGTTDTITSTLEAYGEPQGHSAMALYVGVPCGIAVQLVLDGVFKTPGIIAPYSKEICDPIREVLEQQGMGLTEKVL